MFPTESPDKFSAANARHLALCSMMAYEKSSVAREWAEVCGADDFVFKNVNRTDTQFFIARGEGQIVIAIRGSDGVKDLITDMECWRTKVRWAQSGSAQSGSAHRADATRYEVHAGFEAAAQSAVDLVDDTAACFYHGGDRIWLTGHSLGGALARRIGVLLRERGVDLAGGYTFGEPRGGDARYAAASNDLLPHFYRCCFFDDLVRLAPGWLAGNRHGKLEEFIDEAGVIHEGPPTLAKWGFDLLGLKKLLALKWHWLTKVADAVEIWNIVESVKAGHSVKRYVGFFNGAAGCQGGSMLNTEPAKAGTPNQGGAA